MLSFSLAPVGGPACWLEIARQPGRNPFLDAWIRIDANGKVTAFTGKAELGQGIRTALAQVVAEELQVPV